MKIPFLLFCAIIFGCTVQNANAQATSLDSIEIELSDNQTLTQAFDSISTGLIKSRIPYGVLFNRTAMWSGGSERNSDTIRNEYDLYQAWYDMDKCIVYPDTSNTYDAMKANADSLI